MTDWLEVEDLRVEYLADTGDVTIVDGVSFTVGAGELVGLAGESGSGKSTVAHAVLRVLPPPAAITGGQVRWKGRDLLALGEAELRRVRWRQISLVMQSAMNALNPVVTVGEQLADVIVAHRGGNLRRELGRARALLEMVHIDPDRVASYPHELSGGMRQRVCIAMALALEPDLVIMDEPTTALDVLVQREILTQVQALQRELGFSVLLITHDLSVMFELCSKVVVLYGGRVAETGPVAALRGDARHPYTQGLLRSIPDPAAAEATLAGIPGSPPDPRRPPPGCRFHPRCAVRVEGCGERRPPLVAVDGGGEVACYRVAP